MSEGRTKWVVPAHPPPLCQPLRKTILACIANKSFFLWHNPIQDLSNKTDIKKFKLLYYRNQPRHWSKVFLHWWFFNWFAPAGEVDIGAWDKTSLLAPPTSLPLRDVQTNKQKNITGKILNCKQVRSGVHGYGHVTSRMDTCDQAQLESKILHQKKKRGEEGLLSAMVASIVLGCS